MPQPLKRASGVNHLSRSLTREWDQYTRKYMRYSGAMSMILEEGRRLQKPSLRLSKPGDKGDSSGSVSRACQGLSAGFPLSLCLRRRGASLQVGRGFSHTSGPDEEIHEMWD